MKKITKAPATYERLAERLVATVARPLEPYDFQKLCAEMRVSGSLCSALKWAKQYDKGRYIGELAIRLHSSDISGSALLMARSLRNYNHFLADRRTNKSSANAIIQTGVDDIRSRIIRICAFLSRHGIAPTEEAIADAEKTFGV